MGVCGLFARAFVSRVLVAARRRAAPSRSGLSSPRAPRAFPSLVRRRDRARTRTKAHPRPPIPRALARRSRSPRRARSRCRCSDSRPALARPCFVSRASPAPTRRPRRFAPYSARSPCSTSDARDARERERAYLCGIHDWDRRSTRAMRARRRERAERTRARDRARELAERDGESLARRNETTLVRRCARRSGESADDGE